MKNRILNQSIRCMTLLPLFLMVLQGAVLAKNEKQELMGRSVTMKGRNVSLATAFAMIKKQTDLTVFYGNNLLDDKERVTFDFKSKALNEVLDILLEGKGLRYEMRRNRVIVLEKITARPTSPAIIQEQQSITGKVADQRGPVENVTVSVKGANRGSSTDGNGNYTINAAVGEVLVFSRIGYIQQEVVVGSETTINITLVESIQDIDEVVVIGYGTVRKRDLTGSVSQVKSQEINAFPNANVIQSLSGRAAGVQIRQSSGAPGPGMSVRIRGGNSIQGSNEPLYVIDGFPISGNTPSPTHINTADIESVEILKDASATAIYGSRGANGVVMITTKRGKDGLTSVNFETSFGSQSVIKKLDLMNASEYARFYNIQAANDNIPAYFTEEEVAGFGEGYNWQDLLFTRAPISTAALNVSGGNEKTQFSVSGSYYGQDGIIQGSDYTRYSLRSSLNHKISDLFSVELNSTLSRLKTSRRDNGGGSRGSSMFGGALVAPPTLTPYNEDGSYRVLHTAYTFLAGELRNPINFINEQTGIVRANVALVNAALLYNITPDLVLKIAGGIENRDDRTDNYTSTRFFNSPGTASISTLQLTSLLNENTLSYNKTFADKHTISAVAGFTYQDFLSTPFSGSGSGFLSDIFETYNIGAASNHTPSSSNYIKSVLLSYLGRVNYNYDDRYLATVSIRRDGSSRYSEGLQWGNFPSAALAWRVSNESFMAGQTAISDLKLRASWGLTGSQAIDPYITQNILVNDVIILGNEFHNTFAPNTALPGTLKWETTEQMDFGLDLGFLNNRVLLTADYYVKNTRNLLSPVSLPSSMGYSITTQNVGRVRNKGFEFGVDSRILEGAFTWDVNTNIAFNRNKVIELYYGEDLLRDRVGVTIVNDVTSILREGRPVGQFWGYLEDGYDENGRIVYKDVNEDNVVNASDKTYIGDPNPKFIYGFNSTVAYKNFELNVFFQGIYGNDIFNVSSISTVDYGFGLNLPNEVLYDHWTPENPNAKYPRISRNSNVQISDRFIEDGSYLRLKNIMLGYNLPVQTLGIRWTKSLNVYVSGQNLWTITNYSWWDPETNFRQDWNGYPIAKTVTFGLRAGF
ncbi:TonB-dependent receptor [Parapedobacter tibetensis]|uniref:TonB-dependent receptor n=1 Tax=Parapedobacter tibetensis TaxID=2972951 RepID=UPI00214D9CDC|nr:TonB-dependent receptor [Parapedobacter tibetensis]